MLESRLALGIITSALLVVSVTIGSASYREQAPQSIAVQSSDARQSADSEANLAQLSRPIYRVRGPHAWLSAAKSSRTAFKRGTSNLAIAGSGKSPFAATAEPDFCHWNDQTFKAPHQTTIALRGVMPNPRNLGRHRELQWLIATPPELDNTFHQIWQNAGELSGALIIE